MRVRNLLFALVCFTVSAASRADVIASNTNLSDHYFSYIVGQSFSVGGTGTYNDIVFNFYAYANNYNNTPAAVGTAYLLSHEYTGPVAGLSTSLPGFLASTAGSGGYYTFDRSLQLQAGLTYFIYNDTLFSSVMGNSVPQGQAIYVSSSGEPFLKYTNQSLEYTVTGDALPVAAPVVTATPEPSSLVLLATGLTGLIGAIRRRGIDARKE